MIFEWCIAMRIPIGCWPSSTQLDRAQCLSISSDCPCNGMPRNICCISTQTVVNTPRMRPHDMQGMPLSLTATSSQNNLSAWPRTFRTMSPGHLPCIYSWPRCCRARPRSTEPNLRRLCTFVRLFRTLGCTRTHSMPLGLPENLQVGSRSVLLLFKKILT